MKDYSERYNAIPTIFNTKVHKGSLYHYTSITGFLLMMADIKEKKCYLFPGHMRYQNDMQELTEGIEYVKKHSTILKHRELLQEVNTTLESLNNNIYITCFSANRDLLEQWKYYGSNCGVSIEFDLEECEGFFIENQIPQNSTNNFKYEVSKTGESTVTSNIFNFETNTTMIIKKENGLTRNGISLTPIDVLYNNKDKFDILKEILNDKFDENMNNLSLYNTKINQKQYIQCAISTFIPMCKNYYFMHEKESRLLFFPLENSKIMYREKSNRILPYLKCIVVNKDSNKYPIKSVTIGPGNNQNLVFNAAVNVFDSDNSQFISEEECVRVMNSNSTYQNENDLKQKITPGELACYINSTNEKVLVYCTKSGLLIYKSPIPFRD